MKKVAVLFVLLFGVCAVAKDKKSDDFPLTVHITQVKMESELTPISGGGVYTDSNGNVQGSGVSGGGTRAYHLMVAEIDGKTYGLTVKNKLSGKRKALAIGTMGYGAIGAKSVTNWLPVGDYKGRWAKGSRAIEVPFTDDKGKERTEQLDIVSEQ